MALVALTVRRIEDDELRGGSDRSSEAWSVNDSNVIYASPSLCKKGRSNVTDTLVNSKVKLADGVYLWCTETTAAIAALS
jgi:hypothetical protein